MVARVVEVSVVQLDILKAHLRPLGIHMQLTDGLRLVALPREF